MRAVRDWHSWYLLVGFVLVNAVHAVHAVNAAKLRVCRVCKQQFDPISNGPKSCRFHRGRWIGAEVSKHLGTKSGNKNTGTGLTVFWDCCDEESADGLGCVFSFHKSYDEEEDDEQPFLLNKRV